MQVFTICQKTNKWKECIDVRDAGPVCEMLNDLTYFGH